MATSKGMNFSMGVALGVAMGAAIGAATHNMGVALAMGAAFGMLFRRDAVGKQKDDSAQLGPPKNGQQ